MKIDVKVPAEGEIELGAWLFLPKEEGIRPAITMAHGFAGVKEHGLERFAQAFAAAGFVVLVHDHRNFGTSGGHLCGDVDPWRQIADWPAYGCRRSTLVPAIPASPLTFLYGLCRKALSVPFDDPLSVLDATGVANIDAIRGCKPFLVPV